LSAVICLMTFDWLNSQMFRSCVITAKQIGLGNGSRCLVWTAPR